MPIRKRGKAWQIDVQFNKNRARRTIEGTRQDALKAEANLRQELIRNCAPSRGLEEGLHKYLTEYAIHLKDYSGQLNKAKHIRPYIEGLTFEDIAEITKDIKKIQLKPATINRRLALLKRICNLAFKEWEWFEQPIAQKISLLPERNERHIYLSSEQVDKLASYCSQGASDAIRLAAYTGLRRGELFKIQSANVLDDIIILDTDTKSGKPRIVPIPEKIKDIMERLPLRTTDALLRTEFVNAREKTGMKHVRFHDLRHTWASWLAQAGVNLNTIGELLGHSQPQTTKRYTHLSNQHLIDAVKTVK